MKRSFRPVVTALEGRLALSTASAAASSSSKTTTVATPVTPAVTVPITVAAAIMTHLYQDTLGRSPDPIAQANLMPALQTGMTMPTLTTFLVTTPEYITKHISASATADANESSYVSSLYTTVLGRAAEPGAVAAWVSAMDSHAMTLSQVASTIVNSPEASVSTTSILVKDSFPVRAATAVGKMYQGTLNRGLDPASQLTIIPELQTGMTMPQLATFLVTTPEYISKQISASATPDANESSYVASLYTNVLGRAAEPGALAAWVAALDSHALTLSQVASTIVNSPEAAYSPTSLLVKSTI